MFQFRRFPTYTYLIQCTLSEYCSAGFPHSEISGSMAMCASPKLIAACHVLHRLLMPRHSPCALSSLTYRFPKREANQVLVLIEYFMNHAGSELEWKLLFYPLLKSSTKSFLFPSVACSSYFWLLCSVFKVRSESFRTHRDPLSKTSINLEGGD